MIGYLDGVVDGEVYGWALDLEHLDRPATVNILVNGSAVAESLALYSRPDVAEDTKSAGFHGYYVDLRKYCPPHERATVHVVADDGSILADSPAYSEVPALPEPSAPTVLFMHIPKTAGSALRQAIEPNYRRSEVAHLYPEPTIFPGGSALWSLPLAHRAGLRFVAGHFQFGVHSALPQPVEYITVLRNPFERTVSQYYQFLRSSPELTSVGDRRLTLCEALEKGTHIFFDNVLVRYLSGVAESACPPGRVDRETYEIALRNLRDHFSHVGFQENISSFYSTLQRKYGWDKCSELQPVYRRSGPPPETDMTSTRQAIEHYNQWDVLLYREALGLFS